MNMSLIFVTIDVSKSSDWLKCDWLKCDWLKRPGGQEDQRLDSMLQG